MPICLVLRHVHHEDLGLFEALLLERGYEIRFVDVPLDGLDPAQVAAADLVVAMGGPVAAYDGALFPWIDAEIAAPRVRLMAAGPTLGICLGAQLMAAALGANVAPGPEPEIGWAPLTLTEAGRNSPMRVLDRLPVLHWHGDRFDLPAGATSLASTPLCPHQAFAVGRHALAMQFHLELNPNRIEPWLVADAAMLATLGIAPETLRHDTAIHGEAMRRAAPELLESWLDTLRRHLQSSARA